MNQTLIFIPHWVFEGPLLAAWLIIGVAVLGFLWMKHGSGQETWSFVPVFAAVALMIHFVLPVLEISGINPEDPTGPAITIGLAIRGYGIFLVCAIVSGFALAIFRAPCIGLTSDQVISLGFWMILVGIAGARIFYVIQKSDVFLANGASFGQLLLAVVDMTKGGLVVYGSLIGGMIAGVAYLKFNKLPLAKTADLIAPGMALGLAIGRLGCLMNGCCYGGICEAPLPSVTFPPGSPPYMAQLNNGALIGITATENLDSNSGFRWVAESIEAGSPAAEQGLQVGDEFSINAPDERYIRFEKQDGSESIALLISLESKRNDGVGAPSITVPVADLPARSRAVYPTQIYSAINAFLLCLVLWFYWTIRKYDGEVFALMLILYSVGRFLMELIRIDEKGQLGTGLTISQLISVAMIILGVSLLAYARRPNAKPVLPA
ncbi:MAG: prolipoprotein diacylglyceryl transferase [Planctomycetaceae bacterium]|nr:prolipoprotein diacylglyceryl transferase [Planctomycetaceae bacterium]MCP4773851.1 prolipoprotein diacylglyceryl transferase [Planctomycetaceae bacterium]